MRGEVVITNEPTHVPLHVTIDDGVDNLNGGSLVQRGDKLVTNTSYGLVVVLANLDIGNLCVKHIKLGQTIGDNSLHTQFV